MHYKCFRAFYSDNQNSISCFKTDESHLREPRASEGDKQKKTKSRRELKGEKVGIGEKKGRGKGERTSPSLFPSCPSPFRRILPDVLGFRGWVRTPKQSLHGKVPPFQLSAAKSPFPSPRFVRNKKVVNRVLNLSKSLTGTGWHLFVHPLPFHWLETPAPVPKFQDMFICCLQLFLIRFFYDIPFWPTLISKPYESGFKSFGAFSSTTTLPTLHKHWLSS